LTDFLADALVSLFLFEAVVFGSGEGFTKSSFFCADFFTENFAAFYLAPVISLLADLADLCDVVGYTCSLCSSTFSTSICTIAFSFFDGS
jgi:hypothetical protein